MSPGSQNLTYEHGWHVKACFLKKKNTCKRCLGKCFAKPGECVERAKLEADVGFLQTRHDADWVECQERSSESQPGCGLSSRSGAWCAAEVRSRVRSQVGAARTMAARAYTRTALTMLLLFQAFVCPLCDYVDAVMTTPSSWLPQFLFSR